MSDELIEQVAEAIGGALIDQGLSNRDPLDDVGDWNARVDAVARAAVATAGVDELRAENTGLRELYENAVGNRRRFGWTINHLLECEDALTEAQARADRAEAALRWYADPDTYDHIGPKGTVKGSAWKLAEDGGARARAALGAPGQEGNDG